MPYSSQLRHRLSQNAITFSNNRLFQGVSRRTAFLFEDIQMSFHPESYKNILANPAYSIRLQKKHPRAPSFLEMQSSNSSDALLMNFFAYPKIKEFDALRKLISIDKDDNIEFGWKPEHENEKRYKTEIDLKIGNTIVEAKLTEKDFQSKELEIVLRYNDVEKILDIKSLTKNGVVYNYQLIRNILTAKKYNLKFTVIIDETRIDLSNAFNKVKNCVLDEAVKNNMKLITWQEISDTVDEDLRKYIIEKYF